MQNLKALEMLNLVDFRYKAENINGTSYRKLLDVYEYMLNDNLSICHIKTYNTASTTYGYVELRELNCSPKTVEISHVAKVNSLFKIYKKDPINGKQFNIHIQQVSFNNFSLSRIKRKNTNLLYSMNPDAEALQI